ncbi:MAG: class I SAM-dependent methyltransferase [Chlorobium sp.]
MYTMNAAEYNEKVMKGHFKKIYPVIARQIIERTGITAGHCIDLGGGPGMLGISLARQSNFYVTIYDLLPECIALAGENSREHDVHERVTALQGKAELIPFKDNSTDLVASRGSIFFWEDQQQGLSEVYRVLRPGGWAYIGGGFGTIELLLEIQSQRASEPKWDRERKERFAKNPPGHFETILANLGIEGVVERGDAGMWIIFRKPMTLL